MPSSTASDWWMASTGALDADAELGVGDHHRDLDDAVLVRLQAGHLHVDPDQVLVVPRQHGARFGRGGCLRRGGVSFMRGLLKRSIVPQGHRPKGPQPEPHHMGENPSMLSYALPGPAVSIAFCLALVAMLLTRVWLISRQIRHVAQHRAHVPTAFANTVSVAAHQRAADYTIARQRFDLLAAAFGAAVLLAWTLLGGLDLMNGLVRDAVLPRWGEMAYQITLVLSVSLIGSLIELPLDAWKTFRIEQQFGFNRMTPALWLRDQLVGGQVGLAIAVPLLAAVLWLMAAAGPWWWLGAFAVLAGFTLLMQVLYPTVIAPAVQQVHAARPPRAESPCRGPDAALRLQGPGLLRDGRLQAFGPCQCLLHRFRLEQAGGLLRHAAQQARALRGRGRAGARTRPLSPPPRAQAPADDDGPVAGRARPWWPG